ncbi:MAG: MFS transporter [Verrucomicrobia bacterium]|nr:MFS transporter [Verrucomicrobiota bacterium]
MSMWWKWWTGCVGGSRELGLFLLASFAMGMAYSIFDAVFNNFLNERFALTGFQRSFLEFPRELPGVLVVFVTAGLSFLCSRRLGVVAMLLGLAGTLLVGFASPTYGIMLMPLFIYSLGQHLFMPVAQTIGMELAEEGRVGRRLGQLNAVRNLAAIVGSFLVFLGFKFLGLRYGHAFLAATVGFAVAAALLYGMKPEQRGQAKTFLTLRREYRLFYVLNILYGSRKQLFITFAPWVIVTIFRQPTQTIATLMTAGGVIGILFQPFLGWVVDRHGERFVLAWEAVLLVFVCFGYGFSRFLFSESVAFWFTCGFYLVDQMLRSVGMARAMYIKRIALQPADIQAALSAGITIDHVFSISVALVGGVLWNTCGYQYVFLLGVVIALVNLVVALRVPPANQRAPGHR